jgi:hypothetical protein
MKAKSTFLNKMTTFGSVLVFAGSMLCASQASSQPNLLNPNLRVGIGTLNPNPGYKGEVFRDDGGFQLFKFTNRATAGDRTALIDIQNGDNVLWRYGVGGTGNGLGLTAGQFYLERAGTGPVLTITTNGNAGFGTSIPAAKLEAARRDGGFQVAKFTNAATTGDRTALIDIQNGNNVLWRYGVGGTGNGLGLTAGQFYLERAGIGAVLTIAANGNAGFGTSVPAAKLEATRRDGGFQVAKFRNAATTGDRTALIDIQNGNNVLWRYGVGGTGNGLGLTAGQFYLERAGFGPVLTISAVGNAALGTVPIAGVKLAVCGQIRATQVVVLPPGWCDFVFEDGYDLKPLAEVEQYIKQHKHLPDVPSASEVAEDGIEVGEMSATLLRKIEELTLHMIDLKKENELLKNRVDQLTIQANQK